MKIKRFFSIGSSVFLCLSGLAQLASAQVTDPLINEFSANTTGADVEYIEVLGAPGTDYSMYSVLEIEGDSSKGSIDRAFPVGTTNGDGLWTTGIGTLGIENGSITLILVEGFTGSINDDIDADDDGAIDSAPWSRIVDDVAVFDGGSDDLTYSSVVLGRNYDGVSDFHPGGASRIPNGTDTDTLGDWVRNDFDMFGIPGFEGTPAFGEAENTPNAVNMAITVETDPVGVCGDPATLIHDIQGAGLVSPDVGNIREIEGVVVGDFQGSDALNGFYVQEEDTDADTDPLTSEGIFVLDPANAVALDAGDVVRVRGFVAEFSGMTQINNVAAVIDCLSTDTVTASTLTLPVTAITDFESTEGMTVDFPQTLFVSGNFNQGRFGEVDLALGSALDNPTAVAAPGTAANAVRDLNDRSRIQLDDGSNLQSPLPLPPYIGDDNTLRTGDSVAVVMGVLSESFGSYEIHPTTPVNFTRVNARTGPPSVGGSLTVSAFNVLNYFTTLDNAGPICGPAGNLGCRGADNASEFTRQKAKLVSAIATLDADVLGVVEIENKIDDGPTADLVDGINAATAAVTYQYVATGAIGTDAIRVALLYKPTTVTPLGAFAVLDSSVNPMFNDIKNRPVLAQSFVENATGARFTVAVNHLKSKGSSCADIGDPDTGDEQGNCNATRTAAAQAEVDWLASDPTRSGSDNFLIIGDLNAYAQEDPVTTIEGAGYTDLIESFVGSGFSAGAYSFNFFSESGYIDHGLASAGLTPQVTGAAFWHANADEPRALDYNDFNQPDLYNADAFRSTDHDPLLIGLRLDTTAMRLKQMARDDLAAALPTGDSQDDKFIGKAIDRIEQSLNPDWWTDSGTLDPQDGKHVFDREHQAVVELQKVGDSIAREAIDKMLLADRMLAEKQLLIAIDAGGNSKAIARARGNLADAEANIAAGDFANAILDYKKAWSNALKAS